MDASCSRFWCQDCSSALCSVLLLRERSCRVTLRFWLLACSFSFSFRRDKGFALPDYLTCWQTFFYRFVNPQARTGKKLNYAERVQDAYAGSRLSLGAPGQDNRSYRVDFTKAETTLPGFSPRWDLVRGVRECRSAFTEIGLDSNTFEDRRYTRLKQIRHLLEAGLIGNDLRWREN